MTISKRDKRLISVLGMVLVVVLFVNYLILPQLEKRSELATQYKEKQETKDTMETSIANMQQTKEKIQESTQGFLEQTDDFYDLQESHEMERRITKIIVDANLSSRDFSISAKPALAQLSPYLYSNLASKMGVSAPEDSDSADATAADNETTETATATETSNATIQQNVLYYYSIQITATGTESNMKKLIDTIYNRYPAIHIKSYQIGAQSAVTDTDQLISAGSLSLELEVYMCDK